MISALYFGKYWKSVACAVVAALLLFAWLPGRAEAAPARNDVLRLHIVANSDGAADQRVKMLVRDAILRQIPASASRAEAEAYVLSHGKTLLLAAEDTLRENGFAYGAQLLLGDGLFPDRTYDGVLFPAGEYRALRVVLGRGDGQNFWCVLFPPLCIVTDKEEPLPEDGEIEFKSSIFAQFRKWRDAR